MAKATVTKERKEQLINEMCAYFKEHKITHGRKGVETMVNTWARQKSGLIRMLSKHPDWDEERLVIPTITTLRNNSGANDVREPATEIIRIILNYIRNQPGCCGYDYYLDDSLRDSIDRMKSYYTDDETVIQYLTPIAMLNIVRRMHSVKIVDENMMNAMARIGLDFKVGQKVSRAVNKVVTEYFLKHIDLSMGEDYVIAAYNKHFASLSDALATKDLTTTAFLSVHPLDYINMANGNSWDSCQIVRPKDDGGSFRAGTLSYMGDKVSAVFYTVSPNTKFDQPLYSIPKVSRMMIHYTGGVMVQGRLYPQSDSGYSNLIETYRNCVKNIIAVCEGVSNNSWTSEILIPAWSGRVRVTTSKVAKHYPDYHFSKFQCHYTAITGIQAEKNTNSISIGSVGKCIRCGEDLSRKDELLCYHCLNERNRCRFCNTPIMDEDTFRITGEDGWVRYVCEDCYNERTTLVAHPAPASDIHCPF